MSDFDPPGVVKQVLPLCRALESRTPGADSLVAEQLDEILHSPDFQRLEASWRSLYYLVFDGPEDPSLRVSIFDIGRKELAHDLQKAASLDRSAVSNKINAEYHALGGEPCGLIVGDYEFGPQPDDLQLLKGMAGIAAGAHAPFLAAAHPGMFGLREFGDMSGIAGLAKLFQSPVYASWRSFREHESARYAALTMPRVLLRRPHLSLTGMAGSLRYDESSHPSDPNRYLWGSAAYVLAAQAAASFVRSGWFEGISGGMERNAVAGLPSAPLSSDDGVADRSTDWLIPGPQADELCELGFAPLVYDTRSRLAAFQAAPSCAKPARYMDPDATAAAKLMVQLRYVLAASLIARYLRVIVREKGGSVRSGSARGELLNAWIRNYVVPDDLPEGRLEEDYPLWDARVDIVERRGAKPGQSAAVLLMPRFEGDELKHPLRIEIPL